MRCAPVLDVKLVEMGTDLPEARCVFGFELLDHSQMGTGLFEVTPNQSFTFLTFHIVISHIPWTSLACLSHAGMM
jgi:hypothetical protein